MSKVFQLAANLVECFPALRAASNEIHALFSRRLIDQHDAVQIDPDDLAGTMSRLIAAAVAGDLTALHDIIAAADLTSSGVLATLATNIGTNTTQGAALATALVARFTAANAVAIKTLGDTVQAVTPLAGDTVTATTAGVNETAYLTPAGTLANLTYALPADGSSRTGQVLRLVSTRAVTALAITLSGNTIVGAAPTALAANAPVAMQKVAASTWIRL